MQWRALKALADEMRDSQAHHQHAKKAPKGFGRTKTGSVSSMLSFAFSQRLKVS